MLNLTFEDFRSKGSIDKLNFVIEEAKVYDLNLSEANKKALFLALSGLDLNYNGKIIFRGSDIRHNDNNSLYLRKHSLFINNIDCGFSNLTVTQNLKLISVLWSGNDLSHIALSSLDLEDIANHKVKNISNIEKRILSFAKIICCPSHLWVIDGLMFKLSNDEKLPDNYIKKIQNIMNIRTKQGGAILIL